MLNVSTKSNVLWIISLFLYGKGVVYLGGFYFAVTRVTINSQLSSDSPMSLLPVSMNFIMLVSIIWFIEVTIYITGVTSVYTCVSFSSSKRHKRKRQRLGSSVESVYVLCEACIWRVLLTSKHLYFHMQFVIWFGNKTISFSLALQINTTSLTQFSIWCKAGKRNYSGWLDCNCECGIKLLSVKHISFGWI